MARKNDAPIKELSNHARMTPEQALAVAQRRAKDMASVVVIGLRPDGQMNITCSESTPAEVNTTLDLAKIFVLDTYLE